MLKGKFQSQCSKDGFKFAKKKMGGVVAADAKNSQDS